MLLRSRYSLRTMMIEAARPAAARARRCADDVASEEGATPPSAAPAAASVFPLALGAAFGATARCDGADFDAPGSAGLVPRLEARMRMSRGLKIGQR